MNPIERISKRYGIGELYGKNFARLSASQIRVLTDRPIKSEHCSFRDAPCNKQGGVCTMRLYEKQDETVTPSTSELVTMCPSRFLEHGSVFSWIGRELLQTETPVVLTELPFLVSRECESQKPVGKIDMVLVKPLRDSLHWCAVEMQAVYFSGKSMSLDFDMMKHWDREGIPFPTVQRRPDFRSSGPKRLMPQLQIKVPTITRWGKKTAVVIDFPFWKSLGAITEVDNISNCDVAWFVVNYQEDPTANQFQLTPHSLHLTTLDRAVEGLTGGVPTTLKEFEDGLRKRLEAIRQ
jgi:hypothetical protein